MLGLHSSETCCCFLTASVENIALEGLPLRSLYMRNTWMTSSLCACRSHSGIPGVHIRRLMQPGSQSINPSDKAGMAPTGAKTGAQPPPIPIAAAIGYPPPGYVRAAASPPPVTGYHAGYPPPGYVAASPPLLLAEPESSAANAGPPPPSLTGPSPPVGSG